MDYYTFLDINQRLEGILCIRAQTPVYIGAFFAWRKFDLAHGVFIFEQQRNDHVMKKTGRRSRS